MEIIGEIQWGTPAEKLPRNSYAVNPLARKRDNLLQLDNEIKNTRNPEHLGILRKEMQEEMGSPVRKTSEPSIIGEIKWDEPKKEFHLSKELAGMGAGIADIAAGIVSLPLSGIAGLGALAVTGSPEKAEKAVSKTQEMLTPSSALEKMGVPKDYTSGSGTHDILMKIMSAPHDYVSKPIADAYFEISGKALPAALLQGALDIPAYLLAFKAAKRATEATVKTPDTAKLRENLGYVIEKPPAFNEAANRGYTEPLNFGEERLPTRPPYNLLPRDEIARLEAELNPPVEQRIPGQGELFTQEKPYQSNELIQGSPTTLSEAARGNRDRIPDPKTDVTLTDRLAEAGEREGREGYPYTQEGIPLREPIQEALDLRNPKIESPPIETIDYSLPLSGRGSVGEAHGRVAEGNQTRRIQESSESIPYQGQGSLFQGPGGRQRGAIDLRGLFRSKGPAKAALEQRGLFTPEERSAREVMTEMVEKNLQDKDISYGASLGANFMVPNQMKFLTQNKIVKWAADKTHAIENHVGNNIKSLLEGDKYITKKNGEVKRVPDENVGVVAYRKHYRDNPSSMTNMKDVWRNSQGKAPLTREAFKSEAEWSTFQAMRKSLDSVWKQINEKRKAEGLKPLPYVNNFFPSSWRGDYYVVMKGKDGTSIEKHGVWREGLAKNLVADLKKKFPDHEVTWGHIEKSRYDINDTSAFERIAKIMDNEGNRKLAAEVDRIVADIIEHKGAMKHGLQKTGVGGYLGSEGGKKGLQNFETAYVDYLSMLSRYLGNMEKAKLRAELTDLPADFKVDQKHAINFSEQLIDRASGKDLKGILNADPVFEAAGRLMGIGSSSIPKGVQHANALILPMHLLTWRQAASGLLQPSVNMARLSRLRATGDINMSPPQAFFEGYSNWIKPDPMGVKAINWASKEGWIDPTITAMLDMKISEAPSGWSKSTMELMKLPLARLEQVAVRGPSFMMYEKAMRETIKDDATRFKTAAMAMDDAVVNYHPSNIPFMYNRMGTIGEAAKGLKQYEHNAFGQFFDYVAFAKDTGKTAPLAWHLSNTLLMGGIKYGVPGIVTAGAFIALYNMVTGSNLRSPQQVVEETPWIPDALVQGIPSTLLGYDISSSIGAVQGNGLLSFPGVELAGNAIWQTGKFIAKYINGTDTEADAMNAWLAITPNGPIHNWIESAFIDDSGFMLTQNGKRVPYERSFEEKAMGAVFGLRSTQNRGLLEHTSGGFLDHFKVFVDEGKYELQGEAQARSLAAHAKNILYQDGIVKKKLFDLMVEKNKNGENVPDFVIEKWAELGGDPSKLNQEMREAIEKGYRTPVENAMKGSMTPNKAHKYERMEHLNSIPLREGGRGLEELKEKAPGLDSFKETIPEETDDIRRGGMRPIGTNSNPRIPQRNFVDRMPRMIPKNLARDTMPRADVMNSNTKDWRGRYRGESRI